MNNTIRLTLAGPLGAALLAGCAAHPDPIVDMQGVDSAAYQQDLYDCQGYGEQIDTATGVTKGVAAGGWVRQPARSVVTQPKVRAMARLQEAPGQHN